MEKGKVELKTVSIDISGILYALNTVRTAESNGLDLASLTPEQAQRRMEEQFRANAERPLFTGTEACQFSKGWIWLFSCPSHSFRHQKFCHMSIPPQAWLKETFSRTSVANTYFPSTPGDS